MNANCVNRKKFSKTCISTISLEAMLQVIAMLDLAMKVLTKQLIPAKNLDKFFQNILTISHTLMNVSI